MQNEERKVKSKKPGWNLCVMDQVVLIVACLISFRVLNIPEEIAPYLNFLFGFLVIYLIASWIVTASSFALVAALRSYAKSNQFHEMDEELKSVF